MSFKKNITLALLQKSIAELVKRQDYKTLNELLRGNENVNMFDTMLLNEDIPQSDNRCV